MALVIGAAAGLVLAVSASQAASGQLDRSFGHHGFVTTAIGKGNSAPYDVAVQKNGRIVIAGFAGNRLALARYTKRGKLDHSFGHGGKVRPNLGGTTEALALAIQPDGKLVVAGDEQVGTGNSSEFLIARFNPDGSLDSTFGKAGVTRITPGLANSAADAVQVQDDGKIVVAGIVSSSNGYDWAVLRLRPDGFQDISFGTVGLVSGSFGADASVATDLEIQPDGRIIVGGFDVALNRSTGAATFHGFGLARLETDGSPDQTFGSGGEVLDRAGNGGALQRLDLQPNGDVVAAGSTIFHDSGSSDPVQRWTLMRFTPDGSLDHGFGRGGRVVTKRLKRHASAQDVVVLPTGKIVAVGTSEHDGLPRASVVRYRTNGAADRTFSRRGVANTTFGSGLAEGDAVAVQHNGRLVLAGDALTKSFHVKVALARYLNK
jgi:uncharacterized delta-60 repeat protein